MIKSPLKWHTEERLLSELKPWKGNPRQATKKQVKDLTNSLERFNLAAPLIINTDNTIIGGHFRYKILKKNGHKEIDVRVPNRKLNKKEVEELNLRLNKNLGEWDWDSLGNFDLDSLLDVGFDESFIQSFGSMKKLKEDNLELANYGRFRPNSKSCWVQIYNIYGQVARELADPVIKHLEKFPTTDEALSEMFKFLVEKWI